MSLTSRQRVAIFDFVCSVLLLALLMYLIGTTVGCAARAGASDTTVFEVPPTGDPATARSMAVLETTDVRTVGERPEPSVVRLNQYQCIVVAPGGAVHYVQGGVTRSINTPFPCPANAAARWGNGQRTINVQYETGGLVAFAEYWPR